LSFRFPQNYFLDRWNLFDFVVVIGSVVDITMNEVSVSYRLQIINLKNVLVFPVKRQRSGMRGYDEGLYSLLPSPPILTLLFIRVLPHPSLPPYHA
jgi:hypothetical protein